MKVLALTVGGSLGPVISSIKDHRPDYVLLFVTTYPAGGSKKLVLERREGNPSLVEAAGLNPGSYELAELSDLDDLGSCFIAMEAAMRALEERFPLGERLADYTGGTKTMSVALALAALDRGWTLVQVVGERGDLVQVVRGTELVRRATMSRPLANAALKRAAVLFDLGHYAGVEQVLGDLAQELELPEDVAPTVQTGLTLARAFAAWDRFEYNEALGLLRPRAGRCLKHFQALRELAEEAESSGYAMVWDMVANAQRRARHGRYDDAVVRLYRAVELLAQVRLRTHYGLDTGNLKLDGIPAELRTEFAERAGPPGRATAGLVDAYRILAALGDPLGALYGEHWENRLRDLQGLRNKTVVVHGLRTLGEEDHRRAFELAWGFLSQAAERLGIRPEVLAFPTWEEVVGT